MIQQLAHRCWYLPSDCWEEPDFATHDEAQACENQQAVEDERAARPAEQRDEPCWLVRCDACDEEIDDPDYGGPMHHDQVGAIAFEQATTVVDGDQQLCHGCADERAVLPVGEQIDLTIPMDLCIEATAP